MRGHDLDNSTDNKARNTGPLESVGRCRMFCPGNRDQGLCQGRSARGTMSSSGLQRGGQGHSHQITKVSPSSPSMHGTMHQCFLWFPSSTVSSPTDYTISCNHPRVGGLLVIQEEPRENR
ncbi:hypothetical protein J6590_076702 [Homalodisca vitripennis]|nr:hypothetical protein J6590_076702 [Homalodisca vitripennis]